MSEHSGTIAPSEVDPPPRPPVDPRGPRLSRANVVGVTFLGAIVVLAAFGLFGERWGSTSARVDALELSVHYPTAFRYKQINAMHVLVVNRSRAVIDTLTVAFDPTYIGHFSDVTSTPSAARPWEVELPGVKPGETRRVHVTLQAEKYGRHAGTVSAFFPGSDTAEANVATVIFP